MSTITRILRHLERNAGERMKAKELSRALEVENKENHKKRRTRGRSLRKADAIRREEVDALLVMLADLNAIRFDKRGFHIRKPFLLPGRISFSPRGSAFVSVLGADEIAQDVFIPPQSAGGALPGDLVLVRLRDRSRSRFEGTVLEVLERARKEHRLKLLEKPRRGYAIGVLLDHKVAMQACVSVQGLAQDTRERLHPDQVLVVTLTGKEVRYGNAYFKAAQLVRFEEETDLDPDFARILMKYNLDPIYPGDIKLPKTSEEPDQSNVSDWFSRQDLRDLKTITIDGADSKDFDDALSLVPISKDRAKLYVHIADVSHYVKRDTALDREALRRSTSYYLASRVVPMLPPALSENLCSLVAGKNRLSFTAEMLVDLSKGRIIKSDFYKSIIKVDKRLTYEIAEDIIKNKNSKVNSAGADSGTPDQSIRDLVLRLWDLAQAQRERRMQKGRVDLDLPEPKVIPDPDNRDRIKSIGFRERLQSSVLIEECMLSANTAVAEFLRKNKGRVLYRVHDPMAEEKLMDLNTFMAAFHVPFTFDNSSYKSIREAGQAVADHIAADSLVRVFNMQLLRSFMQAVYTPDPRGHWGLGFKDYCHFTSPIRRYPDLIVHRVLDALINKRKQPYTAEEAEDLGRHTSEQERRAMEAERDTFKLKVIRYLQQKNIKRFTGFVNGFRSDRVYLELADVPGEAMVEARHLTNDRELPQGERFAVFIKKLGRPVVLGEKWPLELERLDTEEMRIYCRPVFEEIK